MARRRYKQPKPKRHFSGVKVFLIVLVVALLASAGAVYANVAPFVEVKNKVIGFLNSIDVAPENEKINATVYSVQPRTMRDLFLTGFEKPNYWWSDLGPPEPGEWVWFLIRLKPINVEPNKMYFVELFSNDGVFFDNIGVKWSDEELTKPQELSPNERDVRKIEEYNTMMSKWPPSKYVVLRAPYFDKTIDSMRTEYNSISLDRKYHTYESLTGVWLETVYVDKITSPDGKLSYYDSKLGELEIDKLVKKYIKIVIKE